MQKIKTIEIWADSFHEGEWCCDHICYNLTTHGFVCKKEYINGFLPLYKCSKGSTILEITVYGSYKSWTNIPQKIVDVIEWGKPDFIAYDSDKDRVLFAVEETAAVPTGNQSMQRCERQFGSARLRIPYWYFISEFGQHIDGGVRRNSIWPTVAALKLTKIFQTPCMVVHYSDKDNIEDYNSGKGMKFLFDSLTQIIFNFIDEQLNLANMEPLLTEQFQEMCNFILSQWENVVDFLPNQELLENPKTAFHLTKFALAQIPKGIDPIPSLLFWPTISDLPKRIADMQLAKTLIKYDALSELCEQDVGNKKAYCLSSNAGSGKPCSLAQITGWVAEQAALFKRASTLTPPAHFTMKPTDFPQTDSGNYHMTTSKNIVYLYDHWSDFYTSLIIAYPRLKDKFTIENPERPVFLYLSNSLKPGRIFGDPFTGQLSAYSTAFGKFDNPSRIVISYFPHQAHTQAIGNAARGNKGLTLMKELTDFIIFTGGVAVNLRKGGVL